TDQQTRTEVPAVAVLAPDHAAQQCREDREGIKLSLVSGDQREDGTEGDECHGGYLLRCRSSASRGPAPHDVGEDGVGGYGRELNHAVERDREDLRQLPC